MTDTGETQMNDNEGFEAIIDAELTALEKSRDRWMGIALALIVFLVMLGAQQALATDYTDCAESVIDECDGPLLAPGGGGRVFWFV